MNVNSLAQAVRHIGLSVVRVSYFFLWPELGFPLLALPWILRDRRVRFLFVATAVSFLGFLLVTWTQAHYAAPLTGALFLLVVQGIRHLRQWKYSGRPGWRRPFARDCFGFGPVSSGTSAFTTNRKLASVGDCVPHEGREAIA